MNIVTILNTVVIINWNYRTPRTCSMPRWVRCLFIEFLPKILFMQRPSQLPKQPTYSELTRITQNSPILCSTMLKREYTPLTRHKRPQLQHQLLSNYSIRKQNGASVIKNRYFLNTDDRTSSSKKKKIENTSSSDEFTPEILEAADKVVYITNHIKSENDYQEVKFKIFLKFKFNKHFNYKG